METFFLDMFPGVAKLAGNKAKMFGYRTAKLSENKGSHMCNMI